MVIRKHIATNPKQDSKQDPKQDSKWSSIFPVLGMCGLFVMTSACTTKSNPSSFDISQQSPLVENVLTDVGPSVVVPTLLKFQEGIQKLHTDITVLQTSLGSEQEDQFRSQVQEQFRNSMLIWQELEVMQIGPARSSLSSVAGKDLRDEIYSWPTINPCRVDQNTAQQSWTQDENYFDNNLVNAYGLDAIEHLLFAGLETKCPAQVPPISDGTWASLGEAGITSQRLHFALFLLAKLQTDIDQLLYVWSEDGENFGNQLLGQNNSVYSNSTMGLNELYDALFYLENMSKERKLAQPLGHRGCNQSICPDDFEAIISHNTLTSLKANVRGFISLFTGGEGTGIDDLLIDLGHGDLATEMLEDANNCIATIENVEMYINNNDMTIQDLLTEDPEQIEEIYYQLSFLTTNMKGDLATILSMEIPREASGDND